jgi:murein DD-endopeptidase MepM/ murein hydrolase activator NlpD
MESASPFIPLPDGETLRAAWPTPNRTLAAAPERFFARTRVNPDYGKPGWTRDCGQRVHRGADIAPVRVTPTGATARVVFTDCATRADFESDEPAFTPHDDVFVVADGVVHQLVTDETVSDFGKHIVLAHRWPLGGATFFTLYAHLSETAVTINAAVAAGQRLGRMGQTSRSADARNWMLIAPHLHFEVRDAADRHHDPAEFLRRFCV